MQHTHYAWLAIAIAMLVSCEINAADVKPAGPTTPEMLTAMNRLSDAGIVAGKKGSLTFFRWSNAQPPTLVRLGLWGAKIDNELLALTKTMPDLEAVSLYETSVDDEGIQTLAQLAKLKMLAVLPVERYEKESFGPTQWSYPFIARRADRPRIAGKALRALANVKTIESLDLQDAQLQSSDLALLASWPKLGSLGLPNVIDDETVKYLQACRKLNQLTLGNREITATEIQKLAAWKSLRKLVLSCAKLSGAALEALSSLETVESIELIDCGLTDEHLQHLHGSSRLTELALPRNEINGPGLAHLAKLKIRSLGLEFNNVRDETLKDLTQLTNVEDLRLSYCFGVTDRGICSGTLQNMANLKQLALRGVKRVTDASLDDLLKFQQLEHINIRQNGISLEGCERLKQGLPKTVVFR
jgi:hypothetical protein